MNEFMEQVWMDNLTLRTQRRGDLKLEISLQAPPAIIEQLIAGIKQIVGRNEVETAYVHLSAITSHAVVIVSDYYTAPVSIQEFNTIKQAISRQSLKLLEELKIGIAGASTDVRLLKEG